MANGFFDSTSIQQINSHKNIGNFQNLTRNYQKFVQIAEITGIYRNLTKFIEIKFIGN